MEVSNSTAHSSVPLAGSEVGEHFFKFGLEFSDKPLRLFLGLSLIAR